MLKNFLHKLLPTKENQAQPKGEKKHFMHRNIAQCLPLRPGQKNNDAFLQNRLSDWVNV